MKYVHRLCADFVKHRVTFAMLKPVPKQRQTKESRRVMKHHHMVVDRAIPRPNLSTWLHNVPSADASPPKTVENNGNTTCRNRPSKEPKGNPENVVSRFQCPIPTCIIISHTLISLHSFKESTSHSRVVLIHMPFHIVRAFIRLPAPAHRARESPRVVVREPMSPQVLRVGKPFPTDLANLRLDVVALVVVVVAAVATEALASRAGEGRVGRAGLARRGTGRRLLLVGLLEWLGWDRGVGEVVGLGRPVFNVRRGGSTAGSAMHGPMRRWAGVVASVQGRPDLLLGVLRCLHALRVGSLMNDGR